MGSYDSALPKDTEANVATSKRQKHESCENSGGANSQVNRETSAIFTGNEARDDMRLLA